MKQTISTVRKLATTVFRIENIAGAIISVTIVAVAINTSGVILQNYKLERDVRIAKQKVTIAEIELSNQRIKNQYYQTDAFLDIAARKQLSKGINGEKLVIVPKSVALAQIPAGVVPEEKQIQDPYVDVSNFERWVKFLGGDLEYVAQD